MSDNFLHGVTVVEVTSGSRTIRSSSTSVIGVIGTAPNADAAMFPLDAPIPVAGTETETAKLGDSGTLPAALDGIFSQAGAMVVVVRIAEGEDAESTLLNVIGDLNADGTYSGAQAFLVAKSQLGVTPRILIAPGFCVQEVVAELIPIAEKLRAIIVADTLTTTDAAATGFANACASPRVYAVYPEVINTKGETVSASPYVAGVIARTDNEAGFWCSPSNKKVNGIIGLSKPIDFSLGDSTCKANYLNENNIVTIINQDGYRLWGNRTTSSEPSHRFLCVRRTADVISDSILRAHLWAVDRNIVKNYLIDVTESVNAFLASLKSQGAILTGKCFFLVLSMHLNIFQKPSENLKELCPRDGYRVLKYPAGHHEVEVPVKPCRCTTENMVVQHLAYIAFKLCRWFCVVYLDQSRKFFPGTFM